MPAGTIITIRPNRDDGHGFGIIAPDGGGPNLTFASGSVEGAGPALGRLLRNLRHPAAHRATPFDRLRVGQRVTFSVGADPRQAGHPCAEQVRPREG